MPCSMAGFPVPHYPPKFTQTHGHWVSDAIYLTHPLSPSFLAFNLSQHQVCLFVCLFFKWVGFSHQGAKILELHLQHLVLPMNIQGWFPLGWTGLISLQFKGLSRVFASTRLQRKGINSSALGLLYGLTLTSIHDHWKNHSFDYTKLCQQSDVSAF